METKESPIKDDRLNFEECDDSSDRRCIDRRKSPGEGFTYVSTVGWICRREQCRRRDDPFDTNP